MGASRVLRLELRGNVVKPFHHVVGGSLAGHAGISEPDLVRDNLVAENHVDLWAGFIFYNISTIERVGLFDGVCAVARKAIHAQAFGQDDLARSHPVVTCIGHQLDDFLGHRASPGHRPRGSRP